MTYKCIKIIFYIFNSIKKHCNFKNCFPVNSSCCNFTLTFCKSFFFSLSIFFLLSYFQPQYVNLHVYSGKCEMLSLFRAWRKWMVSKLLIVSLKQIRYSINVGLFNTWTKRVFSFISVKFKLNIRWGYTGKAVWKRGTKNQPWQLIVTMLLHLISLYRVD